LNRVRCILARETERRGVGEGIELYAYAFHISQSSFIHAGISSSAFYSLHLHHPFFLPSSPPSPVGGGGILVPIFILVMGFSPKYAIPLSNVTILGGSIMNMVMNVSKRHPSADRPLVDWDLILIMEPLTIGGALAGSFLNKILPEWLLVVSLVILLSYTAQTTLDKGFKVYQKESEAKAKAA